MCHHHVIDFGFVFFLITFTFGKILCISFISSETWPSGNIFSPHHMQPFCILLVAS